WSVPVPLSGKLALGLSQKLGEDVASDLINVWNALEALHHSEFHGLRQDLARLEGRIESRLVEFKAELKQDIASVRADLITWVFVFWLGTVGIIVALLRFGGQGAG
ncbi:MAG TPA: hypothetical protein VD793_03255, partial [Gemmatimonadales bacterium]|nr:hypothetical protein [Gemmatimonadales bacterium]